MGQIAKIQNTLRETKPQMFGDFEVESVEDWQDRKPVVSQSDMKEKNGLVFHFRPVAGTTTIRVTTRPSGTEPKFKIYFEIGSEPFLLEKFDEIKKDIEKILKDLEREFITACYKYINIDFPSRGFLLFWQLPAQSKLKYFETEPEIAALKTLSDKAEKEARLKNLLNFLGSDPINKINDAFREKYGQGVGEYLGITYP
jgi:phosphoglucomutase/phosphomannomutase